MVSMDTTIRETQPLEKALLLHVVVMVWALNAVLDTLWLRY